MRLVVQTYDDRFLPVVALYDAAGGRTEDRSLAHSFDVLDGVWTIHLDVPNPPNPSGFVWVQ